MLLLHPERSYSLTDLSHRLDVPLTTLHREAQRLADAELITVETAGRTRLFHANSSNRAVGPLTQLLITTFGPHTVIADEFADIPGADRFLARALDRGHRSADKADPGITGRDSG